MPRMSQLGKFLTAQLEHSVCLMRLGRQDAAFSEIGANLSERERVENTISRHTALVCHLDALVGHIKLAYRMGVRVDAHHAAEIERDLMPSPVQIEPPGVGIDFNGLVGAGSEDRLDVDVVAGPA